MAYIGYDSRLRAPSRRAPSRPLAWGLKLARKLAWERLAALAACLLAWVGIIAAVRAIF